MNHAVKEQILINRLRNNYSLYLEVEPQPPEWVVKADFMEEIDIGRFHGASPMNMITLKPPISIGDTVYQGEKWLKDMRQNPPTVHVERKGSADPDLCEVHPDGTMPIELADKTFKVTGIKVEKHLEIIPEDLGSMMSKHLPIPQVRLHKKGKWFWIYQLEEIK